MMKRVREGYIDVNYEPRHLYTKKKSIFLTNMDPATTTKKRKLKPLGVCSKGVRECRISNSRATAQILRLSNLSPRLDE